MDTEVTIFDKIVAKQIPANVVYEDDLCMCFKDINPVAPVHLVLIPKNRDGLSQLSKAEDRHQELLGHLMVKVAVIAKQEGLDDGFRIVINDGLKSGQTVYHLHIHILGCKGKEFSWPPGTPGGEKKQISDQFDRMKEPQIVVHIKLQNNDMRIYLSAILSFWKEF